MRRLAGFLAAVLILGCKPSAPREFSLRQISTHYAFTITPDQAPPFAREAVLYKVVVVDRDTRQPIELGEGQIFANNAEGASTWDGLRKGAEIGTYYGKLNYVTAGQWAVALRFRRDSISPLERIDWMQDVLNERTAAPDTTTR